MLRQTQHEAKVKFVGTKTSIIATEVEKITRRMVRHINSCCDIIKNFRRKSLS